MSKSKETYIVRKWDKGSQSKDRRVAHRYSPNEKVITCLGWQDAETYRYAQAEIVNISVSGLLLEADESPPQGQAVWLRLEEPHPTDWVEATVVPPHPGCRNPRTVRVAFRESCPYPFFKAVVNGFNGQDRLMSLPQDLKNPQWW
ncbi:MAG TPA: PilZ domain-containing protein [Isosphaeraceae bacterium]|jgi:hypothetical protein|nr:PilZ domain-containing protein [Isosphaeraceae bacterium]